MENQVPETDEIMLQEEVEVNETPGIVQSGGGQLDAHFYQNHIEIFRRVFLTGFALDDDTIQYISKTGDAGTSEPKQIYLESLDPKIKKNLRMYLAPMTYYFKEESSGTLYSSYNEYTTAINNKKGPSWMYFSNYKIVYEPNLFDKIIFDLLLYTHISREAKQLDNTKAYISITSRLYALFIITVFQSQFIDEDKIRKTNPSKEKKVWRSQFDANKSLQFFRTNYDLFNALQILTALGFFGKDSVLLKEDMYADLQITPLVGGTTLQQNASNDVISWPVNAATNPQFPVLKSKPLPTVLLQNPQEIDRPFKIRTLWSAVLNLHTKEETKEDKIKDFRIISPTDPNKVAKMNLTYYMLEDVYLYISNVLYCAFKINDEPGQDEVKTYKEFRNTAEFLKAMPDIIDQAFRSQAVSAARGTVGDPIIIADKFMETLFTFLQDGLYTRVIQRDAVKKQTFDTLVGELNTNKTALLDPANKQKLVDVGFDQTKFELIKDKVTAVPGAAATATLDDLKTVITTKEYYERIKKLAQEIAAAEKEVPGLNADYQAKVQALTTLTAANPQDAGAIATATTARDAALTKLDTAKGVYNANRSKIFKIIQAIDNKATRFAEPLLSDYSKYDAFTKIVAYQPPDLDDLTDSINSARDAILNIADAALQAPVPAGNELATVVAANTAIDVYRQRFLPLRNTLIEAYKTYRAQFEPTSTYKNPEYKKILDDAIQLIETTAPLNEKLADDAFADTPPVPAVLAAPGVPASPGVAAVPPVLAVPAVPATPLTPVQKTAKVRPILDTLKENVLALKRLLKFDTQVPAAVAGVPVVAPALVAGLPDTTPAGPLYNIPALGAELIEKPFINQLISATTTGGSKRKTRRNRNRKNINTRRNNEMI